MEDRIVRDVEARVGLPTPFLGQSFEVRPPQASSKRCVPKLDQELIDSSRIDATQITQELLVTQVGIERVVFEKA